MVYVMFFFGLFFEIQPNKSMFHLDGLMSFPREVLAKIQSLGMDFTWSTSGGVEKTENLSFHSLLLNAILVVLLCSIPFHPEGQSSG